MRGAAVIDDSDAGALLQAVGMKSNYAQPFFVHWDTLLDTRMTRADIEHRRQSRQKQS